MWKTTTMLAAAAGFCLLVAACSSASDTESSTSGDEQLDDATESPAATSEPTATPAPTATAAPTATPEPTATPAPTSTPTPTPTPDLDRFTADAIEILDAADHLTIENETTTTISPFDLGLRTVMRIDRRSGLSASDVSFTGAGWSFVLPPQSPDEPSVSDIELSYVFEAGGSVLFTMSPLLPDGDENEPWVELRPYDFASVGNDLASDFAADPGLIFEALTFYLDVDGTVVGTGSDRDAERPGHGVRDQRSESRGVLPPAPVDVRPGGRVRLRPGTTRR